MSLPRCKARTCGEILREVIDTLGRVSFTCDKCERVTRGLCRDCPLPHLPRSSRCDGCRKRRKKTHYTRAYAVRREHYLAARREKYRTNAEFRQRCIDDAKQRAEAAGRTDIVRAYERHKAEQYRRRRGIKPRKQQEQRTAA